MNIYFNNLVIYVLTKELGRMTSYTSLALTCFVNVEGFATVSHSAGSAVLKSGPEAIINI